MSVDANRRKKPVTSYQRTRENGVNVLVAPTLSLFAFGTEIDLKRSLFGKVLSVNIDPRPHRHTVQ